MKTYGRADAETIIGNYFTNIYDIRDDGVWPTKDDGKWILHWSPACDLDGPGAPNPLETPNLPIPFNANQLAAFMLDGVGAGIASVYGAWASGPDEGMLASLDKRANGSRAALVAAYEAYRAAENAVGRLNRKPPSNEQESAYLLWRKAMVRQLLNPVMVAASKPDEPAPVVAESASNVLGNGKVWTPEKLAEVKAYREKHGTKKTAEHFKISTSLIRLKLPGEKPQPKGYSVFAHHMK